MIKVFVFNSDENGKRTKGRGRAHRLPGPQN